MSTIDIRTGQPAAINTIIFTGGSSYEPNAIRFDGSGDLDFINTDDAEDVNLSISSKAAAYNLYLALNKAFELGLITAPAPPAPPKAPAARKK
jgi:hypothetical protein